VPFVKNHHLAIESSNSFPHSSGIASSASGMSALALGIMSIEKVGNPSMSEAYFLKKASFLARLGSGSAARSIQGPMVSWGVSDVIEGSSDLYGTPLSSALHPVFQDYQDTILLIDKDQKKVSSTLGHNLMMNHPYAATRFEQARTNVKLLKPILVSGDLDAFVSLVESEALTLHALMMASEPYFILMHPNTLQVINKVWAYRKETQSALCFTLDAGANVHLLYPKSEKDVVLKFIKDELASYCQKNQFIEDQIGNGAKKL
jgi:diphosphomevalonate decarboxylase